VTLVMTVNYYFYP